MVRSATRIFSTPCVFLPQLNMVCCSQVDAMGVNTLMRFHRVGSSDDGMALTCWQIVAVIPHTRKTCF
jgi:hypothetical protein